MYPDAEVELVPGGKGDFVVTFANTKLWDKRRMGDEFPEHDQVIDKLRGHTA